MIHCESLVRLYQCDKKDFSVGTIDHWLKTLEIVSYDACNLFLRAKDPFQILWFEEHMRKHVQRLLFNNNKKPIKVHLLLPGEKAVSKQERKSSSKKVVKNNNDQYRQEDSCQFFTDDINPHYTFDSFVQSEENILAFKLLCELASYDINSKSIVKSSMGFAAFNPIYIYGSRGVGKTHLLMATASVLKKRNLNVTYSRAETFVDHVIKAIRSGMIQSFRESYRNVDVLIIDDIQLFARKEACQEELFHTFNTLHQNGKQIIIGADNYPQDLSFIEPRLISRFEWGITIKMERVSKDSMVQIALNKAKVLNLSLDNNVLTFLCQTFYSNAESLCKAIEALVLRSYIHSEGVKRLPMDLASVKKIIADLIDEEKETTLTPYKLIKKVAEFYGIPIGDITGKSQSKECALPRQVAMFLCRDLLKMPFLQIGDLFYRNHSTVMSSVKQMQKKLEAKDPDLITMLSKIRKELCQAHLLC